MEKNAQMMRLRKILVRWNMKNDSSRKWSGTISIKRGNLLKLSAYGDTVLNPPYAWTSYPENKPGGLILDLEANQTTSVILKFTNFEVSFSMKNLCERKYLINLQDNFRVELVRHGRGSAEIKPIKLHAGAKEPFQIHYRVGKGGMAAGGGIKIIRPLPRIYLVWNLGKPQVKVFRRGSYCYFAGESSVREIYPDVASRSHSLHFTIKRHSLAEGDEIIISFPESKTQTLSINEYKFIILEDTDGDGVFRRIRSSPSLEILSNKAVGFLVQVPSINKAEEPFPVIIKVVDKHNNIVLDFTGKIFLYLISADSRGKLLSSITIEKKDRGVGQFKVKLIKQGYYYFKATENSLKSSISAPVKIVSEEESNRFYWGDLHVHTYLSDGMFSPDFAYQYGKNVSGVDFCAVTDHDHWVNDSGWITTQNAARRHNKPGKFLAFLGSEVGICHSTDFNIYYEDDKAPIIHSAGILFKVEDEEYYPNDCIMSIEKLISPLKGENFIFIPHHLDLYATGEYSQGMDEWSGKRLEPVVELCSMWGCNEYLGCLRCPSQEVRDKWFNGVYEHARTRFIKNHQNALEYEKAEKENFFYQDILARGYRIGVTGNGDNHISTPGCLNPEFLDNAAEYHFKGRHATGMTCVTADKLTRKDILEAFRRRKCYATTGARIIIDCSVNNHSIGEDVRIRDKSQILERKIKVEVAGTEKIDKIDVVRNNMDIYSYKGKSKIEQFEYIDRDDLSDISFKTNNPSFIFYYIRVIQKDGHMAYTSPVWFTFKNLRHRKITAE